MEIRARLFGMLALECGEAVLPLPASTSARTLLSYLLLTRQKAHPRARLAGLLWPDDDEIPTKVARRQHRLKRLLDEARAQGASPTHQQLADVLGVGLRTIERDMAELRL